MNIIYLFYEYLAEGLGGVSHVWEVSRHLYDQGHRITVFAPRCGTYRVETPVDVIYVPTIDLRILRFISFHFNLLFYAGFFIIRYKVDVIYVRQMILSPIPYLLAKLFKKAMVTEINGDILTRRKEVGQGTFLLKLIHAIEKLTCLQSQALVCVTKGLSDIFKDRYNLDAERVPVVSNGTNTEQFHVMDRTFCRNLLGIDLDAQVIGFVGTFLPHQGIHYLVESADLILEKYPNARFLLVGNGPLLGDIEKTIQSKDLHSCFIIPGNMPPEEVVCYINAMDVCTAPFTSNRNQRIGLSPLKLYDYLACGKPVVGSDIKGVGDLLRKTGLGKAVPPDDFVSLAEGIVTVLGDKDLVRYCKKNGPIFIENNHTWRLASQKVATVLQSSFEVS